MIDKKLTLSLIIPTYNEERHITHCLDSIARQSRMPDEVIVVDNNSTDGTVSLVKKYPFVRVIKERKQGLIYARNTGFQAAKGDILGRVDADSVLITEWTEVVLSHFQKNHQTSGVTGPGYFQALNTLNSEHTIFWTKMYNLGALGYFRFQVLWGANMAIRSSAWREVNQYTSLEDDDVHEDQDISGVLNMFGHTVKYVDSMRIYSDVQRYWSTSKLYGYYKKSLNTEHKLSSLERRLNKPRHTEVSIMRSVWYRIITAPLMLIFLAIVFFKK